MTWRKHEDLDPSRRIRETQLKGPAFESSSKNESNHIGSICYQYLIFLLEL